MGHGIISTGISICLDEKNPPSHALSSCEATAFNLPPQRMNEPTPSVTTSASASASEPAPAALTEMLENTFSDARSNSVQQQRDSADITNQAIEILRGSINAIGDDEKILEGIKMDVHVHREDSNNNDNAAVAMDFFKQDMGDNYLNRNPLHFNQQQQQQQQNNNSILEYLHDHDLEPMPIHSSEDNDMSMQLASFNDHDDLWPRPNPINFNNESRGGNSGVSININIRSSSNTNKNGIDKNEISSSSNNNDNDGVEGSGEGVSGGVYQSFMKQYWEDLPTDLSSTQIADEIVATFQQQEN